jgi:hypothetical protein
MRSYTNQFKDFQPKLTQQMKEEGVFAANDSGFKTDDQSLRITTTLVGEKYKSKYFKFTYKKLFKKLSKIKNISLIQKIFTNNKQT